MGHCESTYIVNENPYAYDDYESSIINTNSIINPNAVCNHFTYRVLVFYVRQ